MAEYVITHGALWATLGDLSVYETERIWKRLEAGEQVEHNRRIYTHLGYERIRVEEKAD